MWGEKGNLFLGGYMKNGKLESLDQVIQEFLQVKLLLTGIWRWSL